MERLLMDRVKTNLNNVRANFPIVDALSNESKYVSIADSGRSDRYLMRKFQALFGYGSSASVSKYKSMLEALGKFENNPGGALKRLALFHPAKTFTDSGLAALADLKSFEDLTVAGSFSVNEEALAAIGKIKTLKGLRLWHVGNTNEGIKRLKDLPALESLTLGQRLTYNPPACPDDQTIVILLEVKSLKNLTLMESRFSYESLARLKQLTLNSVDLSEEDAKRLKNSMPTVRITATRPDEPAKKRIGKLFDSK